jgi:2',3'-cyclic-nucleotide 2'-phosphodiesterase/3'-nucleotidase
MLWVGCFSLITLIPGFAAAQHQRLTLLHTSDLHGAVLPWDDYRDRPADGSLAQLSTLIDRIREASDWPVLVVDSGDTIQGTPFEQFLHVRWSEPSPTIEAMNRIGYDAMAVGNHEFNFGLEVLRRAEQQSDFPWLSANAVRTDTMEPAFPPYVVIEAGDIRVGLIGLVTPNIPGWERPEHYRGLTFLAMDEVAARTARSLRNDHACDLVVVLAHTGFEIDPEDGSPGDTDREDFAWRLSRVEGVDVLLTGHTHENIPPRELHGSIASQPGARGRFLTRIDLELERRDEAWHIASWEGTNIPVVDVEPDPEITEAMSERHHLVGAALDGPVGTIDGDLSVAGCRLRDCAALDLIHRVQLDASGAELSLASLLTDRTPDLAAGPMTWRWIYSFYVYPNTLVKVAVTGAEVVDILEHAARYYNGLECSPTSGCTVLTDPTIPHYNVDTMAGVTYRVDPTRPVGRRVRDVRVRGRAIDLHNRYTLVCNNYRAAGGGGYPHLDDADPVWQSSAEMTDLIGDYLSSRGNWVPEVDVNWWIAPAVTAEQNTAATP